MSPRPAVLAVFFVLLALVGAVSSAEPPAAVAAAPCRATGEVRFDDGRLLVQRSERAQNPRTVVETWSSCWRPTGGRRRLTTFSHGRSVAALAVVAVRRGRFVVLEGRGAYDVFDGRRGRRTASVPQVGVLRELVVTTSGNVAALQATGAQALELWGGSGPARCLLDAGTAQTSSGDVFGDLTVGGERVAWYRNGVALGETLTRMSC